MSSHWPTAVQPAWSTSFPERDRGDLRMASGRIALGSSGVASKEVEQRRVGVTFRDQGERQVQRAVWDPIIHVLEDSAHLSLIEPDCLNRLHLPLVGSQETPLADLLE